MYQDFRPFPIGSTLVGDAHAEHGARLGRSVPSTRDENRQQSWSGLQDAASIHALVRALDAALADGGMVGALALLNARARFRFTGVFATLPAVPRNLCLYDRENPRLTLSGVCESLERALGAVARAHGVPPQSPSEAAVSPPSRSCFGDGAVLSYAAVPLRTAAGHAIGILCHWDSRPRLVPPAERLVLEAVAPIFASWVQRRRMLG